jgi:very-short-patch-repair endonuclease
VVLEGLLEKSEKELLKFLKEQTGRSESALKKDLAITPESKTLLPMFLQRLMTACENDRALYERVLPFMGLLRLDTLGYPVVIGEGIVYVTAGTDRRATGTHYTPRSLTEEIVKYTLEPLVYVGPAEGVPRENWRLRSAVELLQLKVCDIAMGSGAFLVQTCRYLAERLVEAWAMENSPHPPSPLLPQGAKGEQEFEMLDRWEVPEDLRQTMLEVAQQFRKVATPSEEILWQALRGRKLDKHKFRRQQPIGPFVVDFFCAAERLIVEVDGGIHASQQERDRQRQELLESLGLRFVRVSSELVETDLVRALESIRTAFGVEPPHPPSPLLPQGAKGEQEVEGYQILPAPLSLDGRGVGGEGGQSQQVSKIYILPDGSLSRGDVGEYLLPEDPDEQLTLSRRLVVDRCLYGVDKNPLAVEMAKLSLWLITLAKGRPFTFVNHALKCGDSLLGLTRAEQIEYLHLNPDLETEQYPIAAQIWRPILQDAIAKRRQIESFGVDGIEDLQEKERLFSEAERAIERLRFVGDYLVARGLAEAGKAANLTTDELMVVSQWIEKELAGTITPEEEREIAALKQGTERMMNLGNPPGQKPRKPFHWLLEFPEVFLREGFSHRSNASLTPLALVRAASPQELGRGVGGEGDLVEPPHPPTPSPTRGEGGQNQEDQDFIDSLLQSWKVESLPGFDAIVGNPPFQGGQKITGAVGTDYRNYLVDHIANTRRGSADLCAYFFLNAAKLLKPNGRFGLVATNTIAQGDTREVGLDQLTLHHTISRAVPSRPWPGTAALEVAYVWLQKGQWQGESILDEKEVAGITAFLTPPGKALGKPYQLVANQNKSFQGSIVLGMGFVLTPEEAQALIEKDSKNKDVLFPYLNGEDLNSRPDQSPSRWVINFKDWPLDADHDDPKNPKGAPYAADYPDCLAIVREKVKPERDKNNRAVYRDKWWQYAEKRPALYGAIEGRDRVLVCALVSKRLIFAFSSTDKVFAHKLAVFPIEDAAFFAVMQSAFHVDWAWERSSTMRDAGINYSPSDVFETFPFPKNTNELETIGSTYYTYRQTIMQTRQEGLTKTYNRFHNPDETAPDIQKLRELHIQMDYAVAAAYGWHDLLPSPPVLAPLSLDGVGSEGDNIEPPHPPSPLLPQGEKGEQEVEAYQTLPAPLSLDGRGVGGEGVSLSESGLGHGFHQTKQGIRFTISETARREILDRLLQLNHDRYAEEEAQGLHDKKKSKTKKTDKKPKAAKAQTSQPDEPIEIQGNLF